MNTTTDLVLTVHEYHEESCFFRSWMFMNTMTDLVSSVHEYHHGSCFFCSWIPSLILFRPFMNTTTDLVSPVHEYHHGSSFIRLWIPTNGSCFLHSCIVYHHGSCLVHSWIPPRILFLPFMNTTTDLVSSVHEYHHGSCFVLLWYHRTVEHIQRVCSKKSCIVDNEKNNSQITGQNEHFRDQLIQCLIWKNFTEQCKQLKIFFIVGQILTVPVVSRTISKSALYNLFSYRANP